MFFSGILSTLGLKMKIKDWIFAISQLGDKEMIVGDKFSDGETEFFEVNLALKNGAPIGDYYEIASDFYEH